MKDKKHTYVAIMAGGVGSRFWPSSTQENPKQFLDILGTGKSLLRITYERFCKIVNPENIFVVTHSLYENRIQEHIPELKEDQIIVEPSRNNTAPGIAYISFKLHEKDPDSILVVAPSDHIILKEDSFRKELERGIRYCSKNDALVTLGILPNRPDTGYGYIKYSNTDGKDNIFKVVEFKEKPDLQTAIAYIDSKNYLWNSGMFIWRTSVVLEAFRIHAYQIYEILAAGRTFYNTDKEKEFISVNFPKTPNISVDYAIMEKADNIYIIPSDIDWSDLGTWNALHAFLPKDNEENVVFSNKKLINESTNNLIKTDKEKIVVTKGLHGFIIIDEDDVLLIYPKNEEQKIKNVRELVMKQFNGK